MSRNIALVGCGAIARAFYLPALAKHRARFDRVWLVDPSDHALSIAASVLPGNQARQLRDVDDEIRWVIVATPNHLHFPLSLEALSRGADVLIEKPFVIWPDEGRELVKLAAERHRVIAVNQTRRFFPYAQELRKRIGAGDFGALKTIVHNEGAKLSWPFASGAGFARHAQRTGVIMDMGVHILDFYQYLLEPAWEYGSAIHDGFHGPEGLAELQLKVNDALALIRLSRYQKQENIARLEFENAQVQIGIFEPSAYSVTSKSSRRLRRFVVDSPRADSGSLSDRVLINFVAATTGRERAVCEATSSLPVIDILDEIYRCSEHYPETLGAA